MKLKKLLKDLPTLQVKGSRELEITGICANSKLLSPGNLFLAKRGCNFDGNNFITEAIQAGAVAVATDIYDPSMKAITQLIYPHIDQLEGLLAANYYQFPSDELFVVGITGTNGKTTTAFLTKHLLDNSGQLCGMIGSIEYVIGSQRYTADKTTPDVTTNQKLLKEMILQQCHCAVMEVSSHALTQGRVDHIGFDVAVFTNLTLEHLDYHKTMEQYAEAKSRLFSSLGHYKRKSKKAFKPIAIVNAEDPWHKRMISQCKCPVMTYGIDVDADLVAKNILLYPQRSQFTVCYKDQEISFIIPLVGRFNISNALAVTAIGLARGFALETIARILSFSPSVSGRMEQVHNDRGIHIYVDYAHKPDALRQVLECIRSISNNSKIITVFGCGGDRDKTKRPIMAQVCEKLSDITLVTSDNPRTEDPQIIVDEIIKGFKKTDGYFIELDRRKAIEKAIQLAKRGDIVLIAGKGHETYQIFNHHTLEFDDRQVASYACSNLEI